MKRDFEADSSGLDKEIRREDPRRHARKHKAKASRRRTVAAKRYTDRLRRAQRQHLCRLGLRESLAATGGDG